MDNLTTNTTQPTTGAVTPVTTPIAPITKSPTSFDVIMENCPFLKQIIENKIQSEVASRDEKITVLEKTLDELTATILMGGAK